MPTNVITVSFSKLRISELIEFFSITLKICQKYNPEALKIDVLVNALEASHKKADSVFQKGKSSEYTAKLAALDKARDEDIICLRMLAAGFTHHHLSDKKAAARLILKTIDHYGSNISRMNYESETTVIRNLSEDLLTKPALAPAIENLSLRDIVTNMKYDNECFRALYLERNEAESKQITLPAGKMLKETIHVYRALVETIEANALLNHHDDFMKIVAEINVLANRYNAIIKGRKSNKEE